MFKKYGIVLAMALSAGSVLGQTTRPAEIRRGLSMGGSPQERTRAFFEKLAKKAEPSLHGEASRLGVYLETFKRSSISDPRMTAFDVSAEIAGDTLTLHGFTEYAELKDSLTPYFNQLGFAKVENQVELLPSAELGGMQGLVRAPKAFVYDKPTAPRETITQTLVGEVVFLLKETDGHYLCHTGDGYVGYIDAASVKRVDRETLRKYQDGWQATVLKDSGLDGEYLPAGAKLKVVRNRSDMVMVELPEGKQIPMPTDRVEVHGNPSDKVEKAIETAKQMLGTPYVWGGKTTEGVDCSGLVQTAFGSQGIRLPRDADQQALCGTLTATRDYRGSLRRGDILFFIGRHGGVHHTAIYLGDNQFIEAADKGAKISSFNPADKNYEEKRDKSFGFAKRVLD